MLLVLTVITGVAYPACDRHRQLLFKSQANGSLIEREARWSLDADRPAVSDPKYFWSRPSALRRCQTTR